MPKNLDQFSWDEPHNSFHCSAEWHFLRMKSNLAGLLHNWGRRLSVTSEAFFPSVESIGRYSGRNRATVLRALQELVRTGWAEVLHKEAGKTVTYRLVNHDEWARSHLGANMVLSTMSVPAPGKFLELVSRHHAWHCAKCSVEVARAFLKFEALGTIVEEKRSDQLATKPN